MDSGGDRVRRLAKDDPRQLGGHVLLGRLGAGGTGTVFLARSPERRLVAVKVVHRRLVADSAARERLRSEVESARRAAAPSIARVIGADAEHDPPYIITEYVAGPSLADVVERSGPQHQQDVYALAKAVAGALATLHAADVIHGDLKPRHVLLGPDGVKVADFGVGPAFEQTSTGAFTAPEQFDAGPARSTPAADVFEWGAVVAYAATGRQGPEFADLDVFSEPLRGLVRHALEPDPGFRPTAQDLVDALAADQPVLEPPTVDIAPAGGDDRPAAKRRRSLLLVPALLFLTLSLVAGGLSLSHRWNDTSTVVAVPAPTTPTAVAPPTSPVPTEPSAPPVPSVSASPTRSATASPRPSPSAKPSATRPSPSSAPPPPGPVRGPRNIRSGLNGECLTSSGASVVMTACGGGTIWQFLADGSIRRRGQCLNATPEVTIGACAEPPIGQRWKLANNILFNTDTKQCIDTGDVTRAGVAPVEARACAATPNQRWSPA